MRDSKQAWCTSPGGAYSQGWRARDFIFVTGTGPIDPSTGNLVGDTIEQQTEQTIDNLSAILEADGASLSDVVKVTVHLSDTSHFARYNWVYAQRFSQPYGAHHGWQRSRPCSRNADRNRWHPPQTEKKEQEETAHCKEEGGAPKSVD